MFAANYVCVTSGEPERTFEVYLAGPIFSSADKDWLRGLRDSLQDSLQPAGARVIWPHELIETARKEAPEREASAIVYEICTEHLRRAVALIAVLDGAQVDDGTAWEMGFFHAYHNERPILGLRTDCRNAGDLPNGLVNSLIEYSCRRIFRSVDDVQVAAAGILSQLQSVSEV